MKDVPVIPVEWATECWPRSYEAGDPLVFAFPLAGLPPGYVARRLGSENPYVDPDGAPRLTLLLPSSGGPLWFLLNELEFYSRHHIGGQYLKRGWGTPARVIFRQPFLAKYVFQQREHGIRDWLGDMDRLQELVQFRQKVRTSAGQQYWQVAKLLGELP